jgi:5-methyltetrahydrofolate--homocysteine methyltransferase
VPTSFLDILRQKVIVYDGAMGTNIQAQNLTADDFGGEQYNGCNEYLVLTKPSAIETIHADFLSVGCDVIETDSFGSTPIVLAEYGLADKAYQLNFEAARLAKHIAQDFSAPDHPRFVAGSMGPTTKLPSLGHIAFKDMEAAYYIQAKGLVEGGADILNVETCQDILQAKAALAGIFTYFADAKKKIPVIVSVTIETMGTMLLGTEIAAALTSLEPYDIDLIGMNCATGPKEMSENVRYLCSNSPKPVFVMPNAGIPENVEGRAHYKLSPDELVYYLSHFVKDLGVNVVGGCCGTTQEHLKKLVNAVGGLSPSKRTWEFTPSCSSIYQGVPLHIEPPPIMIGERTNANGSKMFRELLAKEDWEGMVAMGREQVKEGAHILDVCVAYVGRDEARDMRELISRFNTQITAPLMIDSTEPPVIEEALQRIGGKAIVNSINLEDGEERASKVLSLCKKYGAAVVCLTIDEQGMAKTAEKKLIVAKRIHELVTRKYGMKEHDLIFDTLTFTLGSGDEEFRKAGIATIEGIRLIKKEFPEVYFSLGVSNISFGLSPHIRHVLNSVFLHYAIEYGLDMAIVHASKILPLYKIPEEERELCRKLIFDERTPDYDPLQALLDFYSRKKGDVKAKKKEKVATVEERLKNRIIEGDKIGLKEDLDEALKKYPALDIVNNILLDGMKVVGDLFGSGQMQLPFVLQSAEVMKAAVAHLEPHMEKIEGTAKGTMVIATVKGDVHDIGKNLVDIILTNNGYKVVNLGIKCPIENMLRAAEEQNADAIGMSGLLVKSTLVMKENLEVMNERGIFTPVVLGGAALTRRYVEHDLRNIYKGTLSYANDAFDGLHFMEKLASMRGQKPTDGEIRKAVVEEVLDSENAPLGFEAKLAMVSQEAEPKSGYVTVLEKTVMPAEVIPSPPFYGTKVVEDVSLDDIFTYINETALFRGQWQVRRGTMKIEDYNAMVEGKVRPDYERLKAKVKEEKLLEPKAVYGYFPCQSEGDDLIIYRPKGMSNLDTSWNIVPDETIRNPQSTIRNFTEWLRFTFPRQRKGRMLCISDFFASKDSGKIDVGAFHLVTMGRVASEYSHRLFTSNNYKEYLYFHGLSVESAEALAELWHRKIREELNIHSNDARLPSSDKPDIKRLFAQGYQGSRYSFGYPACPSLEDHVKLFELLRPDRIGVELTEEYQLVPEQSTDAIIVHHPEARYFNI